MFIKPADNVIFAEDSVEQAFLSLPESDKIKKAINRAIEDLRENIFCGESIPKKQIPHEYIKKYGISNLWWYPLPDGWRLVYSIITPSNTEIIAVIIKYFDHKTYERKFGY